MDPRLRDLMRMRIEAMFWVTCAARRVVISPSATNVTNLQHVLAEFDRACRALVAYQRQAAVTADIGAANKAWAATLEPQEKKQ